MTQDATSPMKLIAYRVTEGMGITLRPAERNRQWMDDSNQRFAYRCLPMVIANQHGWDLLCSHHIRATWDGSPLQDGLQIDHVSGKGAPPALSHFGHGILTFSTPFLFRTPSGWNLMLRGPANRPKDGIAALDGIIESDWIQSTFTLNWMFTRPGTVEFAKDEPLGTVFPVQRNAIESFEPEIRDVTTDPKLKADFERWSQSRSTFLDDLKTPESQAVEEGWQRDYTKMAQQTKLKVRPFKKR